MRTAQANSSTKERLLDAAQRLMLTQGFFATTVDEICGAAKLTKGSFFHYFDSKDELGKTILVRYVAQKQQIWRAAPFVKKSDPLQRIYGYLDFAVEMYKNPEGQKGCLLGRFTQELSDTYPEVRLLCAECFDEWARTFKRDLDETRTKYASRKSIDTQSLAEHFIAVLEGALIISKAKQDRQILEKSLWHFKQYLKSLFEN
jgi:TetR/AcrR family transcriptional repressor of nem operon